MDREKFLETLLPLVGGKDNTSLCEFQNGALHLTLKDAGLVDESAVRTLPEVSSAKLRRGHLTLSFGASGGKEEVPFMANKNIDYRALAKDILEEVGGQQNVQDVTHCLTRLRFTLKDDTLVDDKVVSGLNGVVKVVRQGGPYQIVIGTEVSNVYKELMKLGSFEGTAKATAKPGNKKESPISRFFSFISSSMVSILPAIIAGGLMKAFLTIMTLSFVNLIDKSGSTYKLLSFMGNAPFYFLPVLVAYGVAKHQKSNIPLAITCSAFLLLPDLSAALGEGMTIFGLPVPACSYSSTVFPALLGTFFLGYIEEFFDRIIPKVLKTTFKHLCVVLVAVPLYLLAVGPLGYYIGTALQGLVVTVYNNFGWETVTVLALVMPFLVATGIHQAALVPLIITTNATTGQEAIILPAMFCYNLALASACLSVAIFAKNSKTREMAMPSAFSAFLGITEPGLYGTCIRLKTPLYCSCIASCIAGLYAGLSGLYTTTLSASLLSFIGFMGDNNTRNVINGLITFALTVGLSFVFTAIAIKKGKMTDDFDEDSAALTA